MITTGASSRPSDLGSVTVGRADAWFAGTPPTVDTVATSWCFCKAQPVRAANNSIAPSEVRNPLPDRGSDFMRQPHDQDNPQTTGRGFSSLFSLFFSELAVSTRCHMPCDSLLYR